MRNNYSRFNENEVHQSNWRINYSGLIRLHFQPNGARACRAKSDQPHGLKSKRIFAGF